MAAEAKPVSSRVGIGIHGYGMLNYGIAYQKDIVIERGGHVSREIPFRFDHGVPVSGKQMVVDQPLPRDSRGTTLVIPLPEKAERLTIELAGKPGTSVALGDLQIFK